MTEKWESHSVIDEFIWKKSYAKPYGQRDKKIKLQKGLFFH
jgi:hypothetical protein